MTQNSDVYTNEEAANLDDRERYEAVASDEKQAEQDAVCGTVGCNTVGWGNPPPLDAYVNQAYVNQAIGSCLGYSSVGDQARQEAYANGLRDGMTERNYQDENRRNQALALALEYARADRKVTADGVVTVAKAFHAFLKGE